MNKTSRTLRRTTNLTANVATPVNVPAIRVENRTPAVIGQNVMIAMKDQTVTTVLIVTIALTVMSVRKSRIVTLVSTTVRAITMVLKTIAAITASVIAAIVRMSDATVIVVTLTITMSPN